MGPGGAGGRGGGAGGRGRMRRDPARLRLHRVLRRGRHRLDTANFLPPLHAHCVSAARKEKIIEKKLAHVPNIFLQTDRLPLPAEVAPGGTLSPGHRGICAGEMAAFQPLE